MIKQNKFQFVNIIETFSIPLSSTIVWRGVGHFGEIVVIFRRRIDWDSFAVFHFRKIRMGAAFYCLEFSSRGAVDLGNPMMAG
jgi:hypothetical protein